MKSRIIILSILAIMLVPALSFGSGFGIYDANAKVTGMGSAFVGRADDASAIFYNPAGIAFLEGTSVLVGVTPVQPHVNVSFMGQDVDSEQRWVFVPSVFLSKKLSDRLSVGFGMFAPIGLGVQYPESYTGSFVSYRSMGLSVFFRPVIAYKVTDNFAVAASLDMSYSRMKVWRKLPYAMLGIPYDSAIDARYEFSGTGTGFSLSAKMNLSEKLSVGAKYRHKIEYDYEGDVDFTWYQSGIGMIDGMVGAMFTDQDTTSNITMPGELSFGIHYKASDKLNLQADIAWTEWSTVDSIPMAHNDTAMLDQAWEMNWEDTIQLRFGGEYWLDHWWAVRAGYVYDNSPIPLETLTPFAPDSDRNEFTFGVGYDTKESCCWGRFFADAAFRYIMLDDVTSEFSYYPADFSTDMTFLGLSVGFQF